MQKSSLDPRTKIFRENFVTIDASVMEYNMNYGQWMCLYSQTCVASTMEQVGIVSFIVRAAETSTTNGILNATIRNENIDLDKLS